MKSMTTQDLIKSGFQNRGIQDENHSNNDTNMNSNFQITTKSFYKKDNGGYNLFNTKNTGLVSQKQKFSRTGGFAPKKQNAMYKTVSEMKLPFLKKNKATGGQSKSSMYFYKRNQTHKALKKARSAVKLDTLMEPVERSPTKARKPRKKVNRSRKLKTSSMAKKKAAQRTFKMYAGF